MLQPGTPIGRYEIQRKLGRGGMGTVYVAHDPVLGRMVAIKVFLSDLDLADARDRFAREARAAAALNHSNIVTIHDFGDLESQPYIVMEYVQGETLAEVIRRKAPVALGEKLRWIEELCAGVASAHRLGVIHRDIKPTNLMIDRTGRLKILDFGIAKMLGTLGANATAAIGTPGYMAPEQIVGQTIDQRSDLFSIGVVTYELLGYKEAFSGETIHAITHRIINDEPVPLSQLLPDAHPELIALVEKGLKKNPADRFPDAEALRSAIARVRRYLESDPGWDAAGAPTLIPTPGTSIRPGTGSARKQAPNVVSVAELTPPPDPRRTDREAIARRRAIQVEAALESGRMLLQQGDLEQAMDACEQALTLDDSNALALELEVAIKTAMAKRRAGALLLDARGELEKGALTACQDLLVQARALDPEAGDAKLLERDLRLARVEQERLRKRAEAVSTTVARAQQALDTKDIEDALALARDALSLDPTSTEAQRIEVAALRALEELTGADAVSAAAAPTVAVNPVEKTVIAPARQKAPSTKRRGKLTPPAKEEGPKKDPFAPLLAFVATVQARVNAMPLKQKQIVGASAAAVVLVIAGAIAWLRMPPAVLPTGTVVIEAVPWATITSIQGDNDANQPLPSPASTPMSLTLPEGEYRITLSGPPPGSESRTVTVRVQAAGVVVAPVERFAVPTLEQYFDQYLTAPAPTAPAPPAPDAAAPTAPTPGPVP